MPPMAQICVRHDSVGHPMGKAIEEYAETVIHQQWPVQQQGILPSAAWKPLYDLHSELVRYQPDTRGEAVVEEEFLRTLNELYKVREARLTAAASHTPPVIWWIIAIGALLTSRFHLPVWCRKLRLALDDDRCGRRRARARRRPHRRSRLAVPRRGQRHTRGLRKCRPRLSPQSFATPLWAVTQRTLRLRLSLRAARGGPLATRHCRRSLAHAANGADHHRQRCNARPRLAAYLAAELLMTVFGRSCIKRGVLGSARYQSGSQDADRAASGSQGAQVLMVSN
jgi:hypothetical protein